MGVPAIWRTRITLCGACVQQFPAVATEIRAPYVSRYGPLFWGPALISHIPPPSCTPVLPRKVPAAPQADENDDGKLLSERDAWAERMEGVWNEILHADAKGTRPRIMLPGFPIHVRQNKESRKVQEHSALRSCFFCKGMDRCFSNVFARFHGEDVYFTAKLCCARAFVVARLPSLHLTRCRR